MEYICLLPLRKEWHTSGYDLIEISKTITFCKS